MTVSLFKSLYRSLAVAALIGSANFALAAVSGVVINKTTGKPQAGATVVLNKLDPQLGITMIDQAKSGADGSFTINQEVSGPPHLIRTAYDGVTYNHMLPPGSPTSGISIEVFSASKQQGAAKISKHMVLFEPSANGQMEINETYLYVNESSTAWNDPGTGTLHFYLPPGAGGKVTAEGKAPGGLAIPAPVQKTSKPDIYEVDFPVKPGETQFNLTYSVPYKEGEAFAGKIATKDDNTYLITPSGVTLAGDGLNDLGVEPKTQAHLYGFGGANYKVQFTGTVAPASAADGAGSEPEGQGPQIEQMMPRIYEKVGPILALALGMLALGFALLYRASGNVPAKESNERGRG